jgi:nicotinate-nucleotide adenylyltransferase
MAEAEQIIIFGGTFDPPHLGHQRCLRLVTAFNPDAHILIVPAKTPPAGGSTVKIPMLSFHDRVTLCKIAFQNERIANSKVEVSELEGDIPAPNYTIATVEKIRSMHPGADLSLLIGEDQLKRFPTWHRPKDLLSLVSLIVVGRDIGSGPTEPTSLLREVFTTLSLTLDLDPSEKKGTIRETGKRVTFLASSGSKAESSVIRKKLQDNTELPEDWISPEVLEYLKSKNLIKEG